MVRKPVSDSTLEHDPIDEAMGVTNSAGWLQLAGLGTLVLVAIVWSAVADIPIKVKSRGILLGELGVAEITLSSRGRVMEMNVRQGDSVTQGDVIAIIDQPDSDTQLSLKEAALKEVRDRETSLQTHNQRAADAQKRVAEARVAAARQRLEIQTGRQGWLQERVDNFQGLLNRGFVNKQTVLQSRAELGAVIEQIAAARHDITAAESDLRLQDVLRQKELSAARDAVVRLEAEVEETRRRLATNREVRSAYSGRVIEVKYGHGEYVEVGSAMVTLVRTDGAADSERHVVAVVFVPPESGKEIRLGMRVDVAPASVQTNEYGFITGQVIAVADAPATTAGMMRVLKNDQLVRQLSSQGAPFQVEVALMPADTPSGFAWTSSNGPRTAINSGTPCEASFVIRERRLLGLVIPPLARLFAN